MIWLSTTSPSPGDRCFNDWDVSVEDDLFLKISLRYKVVQVGIQKIYV